MGLICPLFIKMKIAMRTVVSLGLGWDTPIPAPLQTTWRAFTRELLNFPEVKFPRSVVPEDAVGRPEVVGFFDASDQAYGCCIYIRWKLKNGSWNVQLLCGKARVCPTSGLTTPRAEMNGLLMLARLIEVVVLAFSVLPQRITIAGDSTCSISSMEATASVLAPYFQHRTAEIGEILKRLDTYKGALITVHEELDADTDGTYVDQLQHSICW